MKGDLRKAEQLFRAGRYDQVIRFLEPQVFRFRQSHVYFRLIGISCLHTGDYGGAVTYLQRALNIKPSDPKSLLGLAVVHIKRQEVSEAISCLLDILEDEPGNRKAARALALLRKNVAPEQIAELSESPKIMKIVAEKKPPSKMAFILPLLLVALAIGSYFGVQFIRAAVESRSARQPEVSNLTLRNVKPLVSMNGEYRYVLTDQQIRTAFQKAKNYFADYRDNMALREINRLLDSNASEAVKEQCRLIRQYITPPDFTTIRDSFSYAEVAGDPYLYNGTYVDWTGKISNLVIGQKQISFDLLVGYENNKVLEGVVPVTLDFAADLNQGGALQLLGQIVVQKDGKFALKGISVHKLMPTKSS